MQSIEYVAVNLLKLLNKISIIIWYIVIYIIGMPIILVFGGFVHLLALAGLVEALKRWFEPELDEKGDAEVDN